MSSIDWIVLFGTLISIVTYGVWKTRGTRDMHSYLRGDDTKWWTVGLSIMATQASAITFLSTPGQAYTDGMRFVQFYLGLPLAMIIISAFFLPMYYRLKVYTAYEYLEGRFDLKTRLLAAFIFLIQRGLAAGITIYAPAIILSSLLGWRLGFTTTIIGVLVIIYTVSGGTKAVTQTQKQQMAVMMGGMILAGILVVFSLPESVSFMDSLHLAGKMGKLNVISFDFDLSDRYNFWSGMTGAVFLFMSYFGTDQSQVQRYLSGRSLSESRLGLMMNGILKVPMQFIILLVGVMVFVFYQYNQPPMFFNDVIVEDLKKTENASDYLDLQKKYGEVFEEKKSAIGDLTAALKTRDENNISRHTEQINKLQGQSNSIRDEAKEVIQAAFPEAETNDKDYIFMNFVMNNLPVGIIGLLFAVIFSAAMSSTSSELNALGSTSTIDFYKRNIKKKATDKHYLFSSKLFTLIWGIIAILFASYLSLFENLIQAVNLIGSLFYPTVLGIFVVAFFVKRVGSHAVFIAAIISQIIIIVIHYLNTIGQAGVFTMGYLWYNALGCSLVVVFGLILQTFMRK
jgi:SSS family transporter